METFSAEDIRKHLHRIKRAAETQQEQACQPSGREQQEVDWQSHCLACGMGSVKFEPPPLYCFHCNQRIKKNQKYYELMMTAAGTRHYFCQECLNKIPGEHVEVENLRVNKNELKAQVNQQNQEESWVECSECGYWLHQICVLFNHRINAANSKFTCPFCMLKELESGKRRPASVDERSRSQWPASKLPTTRLSDYLEQWLNEATKNERLERAREAGLPPDRVEKAGELTVRVVCSRNKTLNTKLHFQKSFERYYPRSFRYRSKAILLFQRIDGVDVCLFAMYVQEYGADQARPNNRRVYISYLDSVKYFEPEVKTRDRDALRTYVYHHLIIAYLKHCKERGFVTCNIWACPPPKGENYIFYCHPNKQKVPSNEKLREWYHKLLQRARKYNVVVHVDNMYDKFNMGDLEQVHSATHLPYFEGDFFSTIAEKKLEEIQSEGSSGKVPRSISKQGSNRRGVKVNPWLKGDKIKDGSLMNKLGEAIRDTKADFMLVYLQHECSECMRPIGGMDRFYPPSPHNQQGTSSLPSGGINYCADCIALHEDLQSQMIRDTVPPLPDTSDKDPDIVNEFFDTRLDFLKLCMWHLFQFDTLRRAKHSSMMVLYYLHNPEGTAWFTCNLCNQTIEPGTGARCTVCTDFDVCGNCYATCSHEHPLDLARGEGGQAKQSNRTQEIIAVIQHAFQCNLRRCGVEKCTRVKNVFIHAYKGCSTKAINGCKTCKEYDQLLQLHVRSCNNDNCLLPGCQQQKHFRRQAQANEDQRRMQQYQAQVVAAAE
jgi:E1A/CREB-binding protein